MADCYRKISLVLNGDASYDSLDDAQKSAIRFPIYLKACAILAMYKAHRKEEIDRCVPDLKEMLKAEIVRIHRQRSFAASSASSARTAAARSTGP